LNVEWLSQRSAISREPLNWIHKIWHENSSGSKWSEDGKNWNLTKEILDIPVHILQGIIKELSVKLIKIGLTCEQHYKLAACKW